MKLKDLTYFYSEIYLPVYYNIFTGFLQAFLISYANFHRNLKFRAVFFIKLFGKVVKAVGENGFAHIAHKLMQESYVVQA